MAQGPACPCGYVQAGVFRKRWIYVTKMLIFTHMKMAITFFLLPGLIALSSCVQPASNVKVSIKLEPPPPIASPPMPFGPEAELKDIKYVIGDTVSTKGIVYGHKDSGDTTFVYMGAPYPHQQLLLLVTGDARKAFVKMDKKSIYVAGCILKHKGIIQMAISDSDHVGFNYLYRKRPAK